MYNLIVTWEVGAWDKGAYQLERERVARAHQYTDESLAEKYATFSDEVLKELQSFPVLFAYEETHKAGAHLGFLRRIRSQSGNVRFEFGLYRELPPIPAATLATLSWDLDIQKWEMNRTHWAVKSVDLLSVLMAAGVLTSEQAALVQPRTVTVGPPERGKHLVVRPQVFSIPSEEQEQDLVGVMMPFDAAFTPVYIEPDPVWWIPQ